MPSKSLTKLFFIARAASSYRTLCTSTKSQTQKLERIADELLQLNKLERYDYSILLRHKMGFNKYGPVVSGLESASGSSSAGAGAAEAKAEKTVFDIKLEKFDAAAKIKIIKEVRSFTDLGLKDAKDLVEKAPIVVKKGVTKEEAASIVEKLKALGATALYCDGDFHHHSGKAAAAAAAVVLGNDSLVDRAAHKSKPALPL